MKAAKLTATQTAYLRYLAGQGECPTNIAIGNIVNALGRRNMIESLPNRNGSYSRFPTANAIPFLTLG
jgi:hypothetical protein